jgi:hypothetical protein
MMPGMSMHASKNGWISRDRCNAQGAGAPGESNACIIGARGQSHVHGVGPCMAGGMPLPCNCGGSSWRNILISVVPWRRRSSRTSMGGAEQPTVQSMHTGRECSEAKWVHGDRLDRMWMVESGQWVVQGSVGVLSTAQAEILAGRGCMPPCGSSPHVRDAC